ncbi:MAG: cob(I)yrinic acid a,c-diamide adenosyltransferase [Calditrichota bacterium]
MKKIFGKTIYLLNTADSERIFQVISILFKQDMKIYTKTGDGGQTGLYRGRRVSKGAPRIDACGEVDELNSCLGWARAGKLSDPAEVWLEQVQRDLFNIGADLASPLETESNEGEIPRLSTEAPVFLEKAIDLMETELPPQKSFILPGGSEISARLHLARTGCRRAERSVVRLADQETVNPCIIIYLNRLSDLLFVLARYENTIQGVPDQLWKSK